MKMKKKIKKKSFQQKLNKLNLIKINKILNKLNKIMNNKHNKIINNNKLNKINNNLNKINNNLNKINNKLNKCLMFKTLKKILLINKENKSKYVIIFVFLYKLKLNYSLLS